MSLLRVVAFLASVLVPAGRRRPACATGVGWLGAGLVLAACEGGPASSSDGAEVIWLNRNVTYVSAQPYVDDDLVITKGSLAARIHALDRRTGSLRWEREVPGSGSIPGLPNGPSVRFGDLVIVAAWDVHAFRRTTGELVWTFTDPAEFPAVDGVAIWNGRVYSPGTDHLFVLDARTGALIQKIYLDGARGYEPVVENGVVYMTARYRHPQTPYLAGNGFLTALDAVSGATLWRLPIEAADPAAGGAVGPVALTPDLVLVGTNNEAILGVDRQTGTIRWSYQSPKNLPYGSNIQGGVALIDNVLVAGATSGRVTGVSIIDGAELWVREHGGHLSSDIISGPGVVIVSLGAVQGIDGEGRTAWLHGFYPTWRHLSSPTYYDGIVYTGGPDGIAAIRVPRQPDN